MRGVADDILSVWIRAEDDVVGLIRLIDLDEMDNGSPMFDLRSPGHIEDAA